MSQDDVERVARIMATADGTIWEEKDDTTSEAVHLTELGRNKFRSFARAALSAMPPRVSPELIAQLNALASRLTAQGEYEACDLIDTVVARVSAMPQREWRYMDEGEQAIMSTALRKSAKVVSRNEPGRELLREALEALDVLTWHYAELAAYDGDTDTTKESLTDAGARPYRRARAAADKIRDAMGGEKS